MTLPAACGSNKYIWRYRDTLNNEEVQSIIEHSVKDFYKIFRFAGDVSKNILTTVFCAGIDTTN
ncbi:hypothetical protein [Enterococcus faecalis]|uniref:hypothetical protein n=1 Tax=Enterococcus faecalis TaxID=1351 RepID=UPI003DA0644E